ncbi:hypothetical protein EJB05_40472 [Eragrostis curvula]|uniref:Uncharacterized protein n=1 Tax=Eragrostis curvula TaxID=38414 RepID=A0A5J9TPW0_9POAL|nr:hypothetical protein EJB05_40472 [Eragrostis curvula]
MAAVADAVVVVVSAPPPQPEPALGRVRPLPAAAKPLAWVLLATAWVGCASLGAWTVAHRVWGLDSPVANALLIISVGAIFFAVLPVAVFSLHAMRVRGLRVCTVVKEIVACVKEILSRKAFGALMWEMMQDTAGLGIILWAPFFLLLFTGLLTLTISAEGSKSEWVGQALFDVGVLGFATISCFIVIPSFALKLWETKAMQCKMAISEGIKLV